MIMSYGLVSIFVYWPACQTRMLIWQYTVIISTYNEAPYTFLMYFATFGKPAIADH